MFRLVLPKGIIWEATLILTVSVVVREALYKKEVRLEFIHFLSGSPLLHHSSGDDGATSALGSTNTCLRSFLLEIISTFLNG